MRPDATDNLEHGKLPDPEGQAMDDMERRIDQLERMVQALTEERLTSRHGR